MARLLSLQPGRARRGVTLLEMQAAILILAIISVPALTMGVNLVREGALNRAETSVQWELDHALWRATRPVRAAETLSNLAADKMRLVNMDGGTTELYVQNGQLLEKLGTNAAIPIAENVSSMQITYYRTFLGSRTVTSDPAKVTEMRVELTLNRGGLTRTGSLLVTLRNRPR